MKKAKSKRESKEAEFKTVKAKLENNDIGKASNKKVEKPKAAFKGGNVHAPEKKEKAPPKEEPKVAAKKETKKETTDDAPKEPV